MGGVLHDNRDREVSGQWEDANADTLAASSSPALPAVADGTAPAIANAPATAQGLTPAPGPTPTPASCAFDVTFEGVVSPATALHVDEAARSQRLVLFVTILTIAVVVSAPLFGGNVTVLRWLYTAMLVQMVGVAYLYRVARNPATFTPDKAAIAWYASTPAVIATLLYFGMYSPAPAAMVLGIYFIGLGHSATAARVIYASWAGAHLVASLVFLTGIQDPGAITSDTLPRLQVLMSAVLVQILFAVTYGVARASRHVTVGAMLQLDSAARAVAQREALLEEARRDLDRALQVGGAGRYTGQRVGSFRLGRVIGRGGMGEVYEATGAGGAEAAVKLLHPHLASDPGQVARFLREVKAVKSLAAPQVVRVLEVCEDDTAVPYLAMERLRGNDLAHHLRARPRLEAADVTALVTDVAAGIEAAARAGIVHRDLKPQNLFRSEAGGWKVLDFGISKLGVGSGTLTQGQIVGTPDYMAPEQAKGRDVDHRADVYSLAAIVYRCLTGRTPFTGKEIPTVLYKVVHYMPERPGALVELPGDVDLVLAIGLAKRPDDRFAAAGELADALTAALAGRLDDAVRARGRALVEQYPWASRLTRPSGFMAAIPESALPR